MGNFGGVKIQMKVEVLLATMFFEQEDENFLELMNIQTDIIIGNQCDHNGNEVFTHNGNNVTVLSRKERGVGRNRNTCLFYSDADIILFADNDVRYYDGYGDKIKGYYTTHPDADMVIFNFREKRDNEPIHDINTHNKKAHLKDITKFGTWAVTARRESVLKKRISFSLLFGGGAKYGCGEDSLFLIDCCNMGLNIYLSDETLGEVIHKESTWYKGITEKYVFDKGALFKAMCPKMCKLFILRHVLKHKKLYSQFGTVKDVLKVMFKGAKDYELCRSL